MISNNPADVCPPDATCVDWPNAVVTFPTFPSPIASATSAPTVVAGPTPVPTPPPTPVVSPTATPTPAPPSCIDSSTHAPADCCAANSISPFGGQRGGPGSSLCAQPTPIPAPSSIATDTPAPSPSPTSAPVLTGACNTHNGEDICLRSDPTCVCDPPPAPPPPQQAVCFCDKEIAKDPTAASIQDCGRKGADTFSGFDKTPVDPNKPPCP